MASNASERPVSPRSESTLSLSLEELASEQSEVSSQGMSRHSGDHGDLLFLVVAAAVVVVVVGITTKRVW